MERHRKPIHPGRVLQLEFLEPLELTPYALAKALHVPRNRITRLVNGQTGVTTDTAFRLARFFGNSPRFWLNLQAAYEVRSGDELFQQISEEISPLAAEGA
jgi:addiction module HigA family antidote